MVSGISLANKCQLLFGLAIVLIIMGALSVPWVRTGLLIEDSQFETARQLSEAWLQNPNRAADPLQSSAGPGDGAEPSEADKNAPLLRINLVNIHEIALDEQSR